MSSKDNGKRERCICCLREFSSSIPKGVGKFVRNYIYENSHEEMSVAEIIAATKKCLNIPDDRWFEIDAFVRLWIHMANDWEICSLKRIQLEYGAVEKS